MRTKSTRGATRSWDPRELLDVQEGSTRKQTCSPAQPKQWPTSSDLPRGRRTADARSWKVRGPAEARRLQRTKSVEQVLPQKGHSGLPNASLARRRQVIFHLILCRETG